MYIYSHAYECVPVMFIHPRIFALQNMNFEVEKDGFGEGVRPDN